MGIKNIHILLISLSIVMSGVFGFWALGHEMRGLSVAAFVLLGGLSIYFINFLKKLKTL